MRKYTLNLFSLWYFNVIHMRFRRGFLIMLSNTNKLNVHATYVVECYGIQYPCLGINDSKEFGNILTEDTKVGYPLKTFGVTTPSRQGFGVTEDRGYQHMQLPRLKDMCRKYKLKIGGNKKELVLRLENWYKEQNETPITQLSQKPRYRWVPEESLNKFA